ncbi:hypothetical protein SPRG_01170 [Saprolegnia parasitica CBS 223.65]|uniref:Uncharacterized protein n=1 Tax=Saprolegnia parasitica (strain CBS 223.65) TaxID=695850 RepID=A0A067CX80_SAPPC|nr:hypothetical protein SPRG_01170 [Saprolegnia parasitica CBS 223.65]KDO35103.1 hypothetical protein SPRG_01170 [Saprolegnia parasitica CBS 223.65]|eukprot:XP_012194752.1 hypothetical protein SPRG_01170 [Saprolegnia parasitica CBS 223.65]
MHFACFALVLAATASAATVYTFDPATSGGVKGSITVTQLAQGASIAANLDVSKANWAALTKVDGNCTGAIPTFKWHIHTKWTNKATSGFLGDCGLAPTGNHYDPDYACGPNSEFATDPKCTPLIPKYKCTPETYAADKRACERGDLSGKVGAFKVVDGKIKQTFVDAHYPKASEEKPEWNLMLHAVCGANTPRFICATGHEAC